MMFIQPKTITLISHVNKRVNYVCFYWFAASAQHHCKQQLWTKRYLHRSTTSPWKVRLNENFINPIDSLQEFVKIPLLPRNNLLFEPALEDIKASEKIFIPLNSHNSEIKYLKGAHDLNSLPSTDIPEVGFIGRSNVGKSSLIKAIFNKVPDIIVKTSKKPGHTRALQFFQVGHYLNLVDMPGYGHNMPDHYEESVEQYIQNRRQLLRMFILIDATTGITKTDEIGLNMLQEYAKPFTIVLTKVDKEGNSKLIKTVMSVVNDINTKFSIACFKQPFLVSSVSLYGIPLLQSFLAYSTGNINIQCVNQQDKQ